MSRKVKFAVLGHGFIGKKHAELIQKNPDAELVAIIDSNPAQLITINNTTTFTSLEAFFSSKIDCDFINVCTPNDLHVEQTKDSLLHDYHVICEKPLGLSYLNCKELIEIEAQSFKRVLCVLQNRYSPPIQWLKSVIEDEKLGDIFQVQINCYWNRDDRYYFPNGEKHNWKGIKEKDGGVLFTQFSHFIDILTWCFGEVTSHAHVSQNFAHINKTDFDDSGIVIFRLNKGGQGVFNYSTAVWDKNLESSMLVIGEKGSVKIGGQYMDQIEHCHIENYEIPNIGPCEPANDYGHYKGSAQNHKFVIQNAIDFILKNAKIDVGLEEGILSVKNIVELSLETNLLR